MDAAATRSAGDVDYAVHGQGYAVRRLADPRIAQSIKDALGDSRTVVNVGAGAGSYEPADRFVIAVEPSEAMRAKRGPDRAPAIAAVAEALPFADATFDAAMATSTVHQWRDLGRGLAEMRRVTCGPIVITAFDPDAVGRQWLIDYVPEMEEVQKRRDPAIARIAALLGGRTTVDVVPIPRDCTDGFTDAFYARPEAFLDPAVRGAQSTWNFIAPDVVERFVRALTSDLADGTWERRYGRWRVEPFFEGSLRLLVNRP